MDAPYYNDDDDRDEIGPDYESDRCWCCLADADEPCAPDCFCAHCVRTRPALGLPMTKDPAA